MPKGFDRWQTQKLDERHATVATMPVRDLKAIVSGMGEVSLNTYDVRALAPNTRHAPMEQLVKGQRQVWEARIDQEKKSKVVDPQSAVTQSRGIDRIFTGWVQIVLF